MSSYQPLETPKKWRRIGIPRAKTPRFHNWLKSRVRTSFESGRRGVNTADRISFAIVWDYKNFSDRQFWLGWVIVLMSADWIKEHVYVTGAPLLELVVRLGLAVLIAIPAVKVISSIWDSIRNALRKALRRDDKNP